ncbi:EAL domain-containing protein [Actinotalea sp. K2]|uniref:sensor domain-containing phosphodiesterase n=1 Tax=Actinotalea sp. K2 TaxID=2939438 RepID=UPI002016E1FA|nr:EAL domain-containing protein [Actinotalea sp. K2]MCL3862880.1 EAL domain-containing protein [Actinotalea sp. K2]
MSTPFAASTAVTAARTVDEVLDRRDVHMVFQPVLDLRSQEVVGYEALARGPVGSPWESPLNLFAAARERGRSAELDWVCRAAAFAAFLEAGMPASTSLFVNIESDSVTSVCPADLVGVVAQAESLLRVFVEVNDRALVADPAGLLATVDRARGMGWGIALDDVGSSRAPLAVLPVVGADVVKIDLQLLAGCEEEDAAAVVVGVLRHLELSGGSLCVEGVQTQEDVEWALAMGASYGQGRYLAEVGPLPTGTAPSRGVVPLLQVDGDDASVRSPYEVVDDLPSRRMGLPQIVDLARMVSFAVRAPGARPVVLAGIASDGVISPEAAAGFPQLFDSALLLVVLGVGVGVEPVPGLRGLRVEPQDPLARERFLVVLAATGPCAVLARPATDGAPGLHDVVVTHDPDRVHDIARLLIRRIPAAGASDVALPLPGVAGVEDTRGPTEPVGAVPTPRGGWRDRIRG